MADKEKSEKPEKSEKKKRGDATARPTQRVNPLTKYFRETRGELRKVVWPTREESMRLTMIVLGATAVFAIFLGLMDAGFSALFELLINAIA